MEEKFASDEQRIDVVADQTAPSVDVETPKIADKRESSKMKRASRSLLQV